jgi:hypothetical protein
MTTMATTLTTSITTTLTLSRAASQDMAAQVSGRSAVCWCGQDLGLWQPGHCPRCGTQQRQR